LADYLSGALFGRCAAQQVLPEKQYASAMHTRIAGTQSL